MPGDDARRPGAPQAGPPRCAECGERIAPGRAPGTWTHRARLVAACDLDADHPAVPAGADRAAGADADHP